MTRSRLFLSVTTLCRSGILAVALALCPAIPAFTEIPDATIQVVDARAEVAAALYGASATLAAAQRSSDEKLRAQRTQIENLHGVLRAGDEKLSNALAAAQEQFVAALGARDRAYAEEIAVFRKAVEDIAATPQGAAALARFNAGDEIGALAVLDELLAARDKARQKRADIKSAVEGRRIATLALEARTRGKPSTAEVLARFEEVVQLDPGVHWDWVELGRLYQDARRLADSERAARAAAKTAVNDRDRMVAFGELGNVLTARGNGPAALAAYRQSKSIAEACARRDRTNLGWQRDLSLSPDIS